MSCVLCVLPFLLAPRLASAAPTVAAVAEAKPGCAPLLQASATAEATAFLTSAAFPEDALRIDTDPTLAKDGATNATILYVADACGGTTAGKGGRRTRYVFASGDASAARTDATKSTSFGDVACLFGHLARVVDGPAVGGWMLEQLATTDEPIAEAYFRAVRRVHPLGSPAVRCFGTDGAAARLRLATGRRFLEERPSPVTAAASAWLAEAAVPLAGVPALVTAPRTLTVTRRALKTEHLARMLLGAGVRNDTVDATASTLQVYRTDAGTMTYEPLTGRLAWRQTPKPLAAGAETSETVPSTEASVALALEFLSRKQLVADAGQELAPAWSVERRAGDDDGAAMTVVARTIVLAQRLSGALPLGGAGTVEVTVGPGGGVIAVTASLLDTSSPAPASTIGQGALDAATQRAVAELGAKLPGARLTVVSTRLGYDAGDASELTKGSRFAALSLEALIEAETPTSRRRFPVKIGL